MEQRKVVVKVVKKQAVEKNVERKIKDPRPIAKEGLIAWQNEGRRLSKGERLFLDNKRFFNFAQDIDFMERWIQRCTELGIKPNERLTALIEKDIAE